MERDSSIFGQEVNIAVIMLSLQCPQSFLVVPNAFKTFNPFTFLISHQLNINPLIGRANAVGQKIAYSVPRRRWEVERRLKPRGSLREKSVIQSIGMKFLRRMMGILAALLHATAALYYLAISPPLHLFYEVAPPAGANSVYVPGKPSPAFKFRDPVDTSGQ
jgi:hypothetical protein